MLPTDKLLLAMLAMTVHYVGCSSQQRSIMAGGGTGGAVARVINCRDEFPPAPNPGGSQLETMGRLRNSGKVPGALKRDQQSQRTGLLGLVRRLGEAQRETKP